MSLMDSLSADERRLMHYVSQGDWNFRRMPAESIRIGDVVMTGRSGCSAPVALIDRDGSTVNLLCGFERLGVPLDAEPTVGRRQPTV